MFCSKYNTCQQWLQLLTLNVFFLHMDSFILNWCIILIQLEQCNMYFCLKVVNAKLLMEKNINMFKQKIFFTLITYNENVIAIMRKILSNWWLQINIWNNHVLCFPSIITLQVNIKFWFKSVVKKLDLNHDLNQIIP